MTTEGHLISERNLNHLGGGHNYSFRFETSLDNNNSAVDENNCSTGEDSHNSSNASSGSSGRKPSYVGLSCTVSGYGNFTRYQSPSRKTSPSAIPVSSPPQILDCNEYVVVGKMRKPTDRDSPPVRGQLDYDCADNASTPNARHYFPSSQTRKIVTTDGGETTVETVTRFYGQRNAREESPCSDSSSSIGSLGSGNGNTGNGNLVQKQIERLYGGRVHSVRLTSPEPKSPESDELSPHETSDQKVTGGFFAKRFGIVKQKDYSSKQRRDTDDAHANHPLELKTLKVPAVFRLLRPEFREQLKLNSCQVGIPLDHSTVPPKKERIIPIVREHVDRNEATTVVFPEKTVVTEMTSERLIPIVVEKQNGENKVASRDIHVTSTSLKTVTTRTPRSPVKPALPAKPLSPTRPSRVTPPLSSPPDSSAKKSPSSDEDRVITVTIEKLEDPSIPEKVMIEEIVTPDEVVVPTTNGASHPDEKCEELVPAEKVHHQESIEVEREQHKDSVRHFDEDEEEEDPFHADRYLRSSTSPPCGVRERSLLCPIQEEDTESTASGCSGIANNRFATASSGSKEPTPVSIASQDDSEPLDRSVVIVDEFLIMPKLEAEHDGHYFIKVNSISNFIVNYKKYLKNP